MDDLYLEASIYSHQETTSMRPSRVLIRPLSVEHLHLLFAAAHRGPMKVFFLVAATTGMRNSEILALKWQDLDLDQQTAFIRRRLVSTSSQTFQEAGLKREGDRRMIFLTPIVTTALKHHLVCQNDLRAQAGANWQDHGFVFGTSVGLPLQTSTVIASYKALLRLAGLPERRFHDLRYSPAQILLEMGTNLDVVRAILGISPQKNRPITPMASHGFPTLIREAVLRLNNVLQR